MKTAKPIKVLLTGANGQLGYELQRSKPAHIQLQSTDSAELDITNAEAVDQYCKQHQINLIINAAAYTAVDKAETESDLAYLVNQQGAMNLAATAKSINAKLVHVSTDFVVTGQQSTPYLPDAPTEAHSVYGKSKADGEQAIIETLPDNHIIIRTSWLYSAHGNNFVKTMLRLMKDKPKLGIVADQIGSPTWANTLADCIWLLIEKNATGIYHCSDNGVASWYDFAIAIQKLALEKQLLSNAIPIDAIRTEDYPTPASRPSYSVLDKTTAEQCIEKKFPHWQTSLSNMLDELKNHE